MRKTSKSPISHGKPKQLSFLKAPSLSYGGTLLRTRKGRASGRPLSIKDSLHLVLRSSKATGKWSFRLPSHKRKILQIIEKFAGKYSVQIKSFANVGNHLHIHLRLQTRAGYRPFIRAITGAIAVAVTGATRWNRSRQQIGKLKFWDYRPFTRVVRGFQATLRLQDYIRINQWEGHGLSRDEAYTRVHWRLSTA